MSPAEQRTRNAPTPSGYLHTGNGVAFALTALLARMHRASLRLRIDDLDAERARSSYVQDIFDSLAWLGISWTEGPRDPTDQERSFSQLKRLDRYAEAIAVLKEQGDLYACRCSRSRLRDMVKQGRRDCECRGKHIDFNDPNATWRLHMASDASVRMHALHGASSQFHPATLMTDPVIRQRQHDGGRPAYQIASLIDDVDFGTTFIVRGEDLLPSTACQLYLAERLGLHAFKDVRFIHHPLVTDAQGRKLSKSEGAEALKSMRERGSGRASLLRQAEEMLAAIVRG
ncbi:MAG: tRNA glutamyl-Q synthetase [Flavobacteriales bacterium]|nr:tRNA glutamyl-Q synthetase [Flavobacteriales bacterium]